MTKRDMRFCTIASVLLLSTGAVGAGGPAAPGGPEPAADHPQYTSEKELIRPEYREWIFLSSGLGMSYNPARGGEPKFTNVFVPRWAYAEFVRSGKWPAQTMLVVEDRLSATQGSINKAGHFQTDLASIGVEVKDEGRFPDKWAYFSFDAKTQSAKARLKSACWQCHEDHAAVEHTFVQFYPTLKPVAEKLGTYHAKDQD